MIICLSSSVVLSQNSIKGNIPFEKETKIINYDPSMYPTPKQGGEDIAGAVVIALPYTNTGTTAGFANNYDEVCPYSGSTSPDVVYSYTPGADESLDIDLFGSFYDTKVFVYEDVATPGFPYACNDDFYSDYTSALFGLSVYYGHTYYIVIDGYGGDFGTYAILITAVPIVPPPANDDCSTAIAIGEVIDMAFSTINSTQSGENPGCGGSTNPYDIWYVYTASYSGPAVFDLCGSAYDTRLALYDACGGTVLACNDDACGLSSGFFYTVTASASYYVQIGGYNDAVGTGFLSIAFEDTEWTGAAKSNDWNTAGNWTYGIPSSTTNVTIPAGLSNYPTLTSAGVCNNLYMYADASGYATLLDGGFLTLSGSAYIQAYLTGNVWHFIGSPVSGATADVFKLAGGQPDVYLQSFDETTNTYTDIVPVTTPLNVMEGYAAWVDGSSWTFTYPGALNTGAYGAADNMTRTIDGDDGGNNLLSNPYPSGIDWDAALGWTKTNMMDAFYIEDAGGWATYVSSVGVGTGSVIAPGQGFFVFVNYGGAPTTGTLIMDNSVRVHTATPFIKDAVANLVRLEVQGNNKTDETVVRFLEEATALFDGKYDAFKLEPTDGAIPQLYSIANKDMAINTLPETDWVQLGFKANFDGEYTISAIEINDIASVWLEDTFTGEFTNLTMDSYTFNHSVINAPERFILHFTPLAVPENMADMINIYSNNHDVYVAVPANTRGTVKVYNLMGQEAASTTITEVLTRITLDKSAYYVVEVVSDESVVTKKVFVK